MINFIRYYSMAPFFEVTGDNESQSGSLSVSSEWVFSEKKRGRVAGAGVP